MFSVIVVYLHPVRLFFVPGCAYARVLVNSGLAYIVATLIIVLTMRYLAKRPRMQRC